MRSLAAASVLFGLLAALASCTADLTEACVGGRCDTTTSSTTGTGGGGGSGGGGGGAGGGACTPNPATGEFPCEVFTVLQAKCQTCHAPDKLAMSGAPFSLLTYEDTQQPFAGGPKLRWQRMSEVIQPGAIPHMPFGSAPQLTPDEKKTLDAWFADCAKPAPDGMGCE